MDISLIETLRWEPETGFVRVDRHLSRLAQSAEALGLKGAEKARDALLAEGGDNGGTAATSPLRVRLELFPDGRIDIQAARFTPLAPDAAWRLRIASTRLTSIDPLLRHKTSRRAPYAAARAEFAASEADEVVLLNERGEVCEGTITSIFLDDGSDVLKTPPLSSGLLAGVLRAELLETGRAAEQVLLPEDLSRHRLFTGNSLRGLIASTLA